MSFSTVDKEECPPHTHKTTSRIPTRETTIWERAGKRFQEEDDVGNKDQETVQAEWQIHCAFMPICIVCGLSAISNAGSLTNSAPLFRGRPVSPEALY